MESIPVKDAVPINGHDIVCVRQVYEITPQQSPELIHKPRFGSPQYSGASVEWMENEYRKNTKFFSTTRQRAQERWKHPR